MAKPRIKIEFHDEGFIELLKSQEIEGELLDQAQAVADRAGDGFEAELGTGGKTRSRAFARAATPEAIAENARDATLLRALGR